VVSLMLKFVRDEDGATAIEYALIAGLMSIVIITAATAMGVSLVDFFTRVVFAFPT
jgi:pilus assembly protein Flp/PilA